jgi:hypothetical protein
MSRDTLNNDHQQHQSSTRLIPLPDWNKYHAWPPIGGLRHLRFNCKYNGFETAFKSVGRRVLVDEFEFFACVERQNGGA